MNYLKNKVAIRVMVKEGLEMQSGFKMAEPA
jgi:hypothetical protein